MTTINDDLDALRAIVKALEPFEDPDRDRIIRWAREKLGMQPALALAPPAGLQAAATPPIHERGDVGSEAQDIRSFVRAKSPKSDQQFVAVVAYYHRFLASGADRKETITSSDLVTATRLADRTRLTQPSKTLNNAHGAGYLDKVERGAYRLNSVGENLVAMVLPGGSAAESKGKRPPRFKKAGQRGRKKHKAGTKK